MSKRIEESNFKERVARLKSLTGFTLIEVLCSVFILGLALVSILAAFSMGAKASAFTEEKLIAYTLLEEKMEELEASEFSELADEARAEVLGFSGYDIAVAVTDVGSNTDLKEVQVTIYWTGPFGQEISETFTTLIANHARDLVESS